MQLDHAKKWQVAPDRRSTSLHLLLSLLLPLTQNINKHKEIALNKICLLEQDSMHVKSMEWKDMSEISEGRNASQAL